jgi:hypothetical protein
VEKPCKICKKVQPLENYYRAKGTRDGHRGECKGCFKERAAKRYRENPEPVKQRARQWQRDNHERHAEYMRGYRASGRRSEVDRRSHLRRKFGITPERYDEMLEAQGGGCAICRKPPRDDISLHVDHDHDSGAIRGLLCFDCNAGIGKLREDVDLLGASITYLLDHDPEMVEMGERARSRLAALLT